MEVVEAEGEEATVASEAAAESPPAPAAPAAGGLRFAEDLAPAMTPAPKKAKKGKGKSATDEAAEEKGKKAARKGRRLAAVVEDEEEEEEEEEDIDFETGLDQFGWSEEAEEKDAED
ncbi:MAG: hypothetical protein IIA90_07210 [Chloroflexi bacterium]|nr:hypothetical protein [Chloroflexota bacterium]